MAYLFLQFMLSHSKRCIVCDLIHLKLSQRTARCYGILCDLMHQCCLYLQGPSAKAAAAAAPPPSKLFKAKAGSAGAPAGGGSSSSSAVAKSTAFGSLALSKSKAAAAGGLTNVDERRSNWVKVGVVSLRDLGLKSLDPQVLAGKGMKFLSFIAPWQGKAGVVFRQAGWQQ